MQFQPKLPQPSPEILQEAVRFRLRLESQHRVVGIAHDDHVSARVFPLPPARKAEKRVPRRYPNVRGTRCVMSTAREKTCASIYSDARQREVEVNGEFGTGGS